MAHDVFVSYPSEDKATADAVVAVLEQTGVRCWVAPRDVPPGRDWAGAIVQAIGQARLLVLVFSDASNHSEHILREVREASEVNIPILPFRTTADAPSPALKYYIGGTHWLDAMSEPLERHLDELAFRVLGILTEPDVEASVRVPARAPRVSQPMSPRPPLTARAPKRKVGRLAALGAGGVAGVAVLAMMGVWLFGSGGEASDTTGAGAGSSTSTTRAATTTTAEVVASWSAQFVPSVYATANDNMGPVACRLGSRDLVCEVLDDGDMLFYTGVALADFDNDGHVDVVLAASGSDGWGEPGPNFRCLWRGSWVCAHFDRFEDRRASGRVMPSWSVATGDLNGDGWVDVVFGNAVDEAETRLRAEVCYGIESGTGFRCWMLPDTENPSTGSGVQDVEIAEIDGDGILDVVLVGSGMGTEICFGGHGDVLGTGPHPDEIAPFACVAPHDGGGASGGPTDFTNVAVGDLDADGFEDLLLSHPGHSAQWCRGLGDRAFECEELDEVGVHSLLIADLTGDGHLDAVFGHATATSFLGHLGVCTGPLEFGVGCEPAMVSGTGGGFDWWVDPILADYDGDGVEDLIGQDMFLRGLGGGLFSGDPRDGSIRGIPRDFAWASSG